MSLLYPEIFELAYRGLLAAGIHQAQAKETAQFLALAEFDGLGSHGLARVSQYAGHALNQRIKLNPKIKTERFKKACALVNADDGLAFPALRLATDLSVNLASDAGIGLVAVNNSHHFGVAGHYVEAAARAGFISLMFGNTPAAMPMLGGKEAIFGTNPIAVSFPMPKGDPLVIDMSLSAVARGKLLIAAKKGEKIPEGWALTADGQPTTNPHEGLKGLMVPLGGDKGALLALMIELMVVGLSGSRFSFEADSFFDAKGNKPRIGQVIISIDPGVGGKNIFSDQMNRFCKKISQSEGTRFPGERRFKQRKISMREGIKISDSVLSEIQEGIKNSWKNNF
ncbi:Ldh family oxidoreductase [Polynucleobacter paneuropaeus]|nr:Ldh family oxidoreductase [Polynucleobacter paneuropaeus]